MIDPRVCVSLVCCQCCVSVFVCEGSGPFVQTEVKRCVCKGCLGGAGADASGCVDDRGYVDMLMNGIAHA